MKTTKRLFFSRSSGTRATFRRAVLEDALPRLRTLPCDAMKVDFTERDHPRQRVLPLRRENLLMVSTWGDVEVDGVLEVLRSFGGETFGYEVEESYPRQYERTWPDGERSPGDILLTLLSKNDALTDADFMHEWHGRHTPKALRIHPMWRYARNVVIGKLGHDSPTFEGIVEEHYRTLDDLVNPVRMFGGPLRFLPNMVEVALHARHFLDLERTENYLVSEWHVVRRRP